MRWKQTVFGLGVWAGSWRALRRPAGEPTQVRGPPGPTPTAAGSRAPAGRRPGPRSPPSPDRTRPPSPACPGSGCRTDGADADGRPARRSPTRACLPAPVPVGRPSPPRRGEPPPAGPIVDYGPGEGGTANRPRGRLGSTAPSRRCSAEPAVLRLRDGPDEHGRLPARAAVSGPPASRSIRTGAPLPTDRVLRQLFHDL